MNRIRTAIKTLRLSFLVLTPVCAFLAYSQAMFDSAVMNKSMLMPVLITAMCAHIAVNMLNEYMDYKSGLDFITTKTPFSGGSGALPENAGGAALVLWAAILTVLMCVITGFWIVYNVGLELLIPGIAGLVIVIAYTPWINRHPWLCLIAPGTGFGIIMMLTSYYVLTEKLSVSALISSLVIFFLVNNLLLLNQYPDREADKKIGRKNIVIEFGFDISNRVYLFFSLSVVSLIIISVGYQIYPVTAILSLLPWLLSIVAIYGAKKYQDKIAAKPHFLAMNVLASLLVPMTLSITMVMN